MNKLFYLQITIINKKIEYNANMCKYQYLTAIAKIVLKLILLIHAFVTNYKPKLQISFFNFFVIMSSISGNILNFSLHL